MDERTTAFFRFIDLRVYSKALDYSKWVISALPQPRNEGERNLHKAFFSSASEIALNIAEGSSRNNMQFEHYLKVSKSAIRECFSYTEIGYRLELFNEDQRERSQELLMELMRMIGALIVSLNRKNSHRNDDRSEHDDYPQSSRIRKNDGDREAGHGEDDAAGNDQIFNASDTPGFVGTNFESEFKNI